MTSDAEDAPRGRDAVKRALLDAAAELFAARGASAVSVRDVAARAGVNHGLVHRHFGSKQALQREVMHALTERMASRVGQGGDALEALEAALESSAMRLYFRMLARSLLDGVPVHELQDSFPVVELALSRVQAEQSCGATRDDVDARLVVALGIAAGLGWLVFEPFIVASLGLSRRRHLRRDALAAWSRLVAGRHPSG